MGQLRKQEESRQQRILKAKEDLVAAELELKNLPPFETPKAELERLATQILEIGVLVNQKRAHKDEKEKLLAQKKGSLRQCQDRLKDMENTNNKRLQALRNSGADKIFDAYKWLQNHQHELNKEVYGPVLLEVNVSNRTHADYLEGHLPYYIWKSFITQDPGDRDFLVTNLKSCDVPILNYMGDSHHNKSFQISEEMHALGIHSRLDQVFDAPGAVKEVLNNQFGLDHSYIGSKDSDQKADAVANLGILDFWTPENHYRWTTSRYGSHISGSVEAVDRSRLLFCNLDVGEIERVRMSKTELEETIVALEENVRLLQSEQRHLEDEAAKLQKQREEIINNVQLQKRKRQDMENRLSQRKRRVESFENEDDVDTVLAKLIEQVGKCNIQRFHCVINIKNLLVEAVSYKKSIAENHMASIEFDVKIRELENDFKQYEKFALEMSWNFEHFIFKMRAPRLTL